ncbi:6-hydroxymethylpterin diphosphokinase MptE-like protein [Haladaptatus salinisoli]|uniref:6-hydroxymethylpterin diphosphokinase MptE-like protein n=1 Tax=Haladaptatus salinisoli TaxID=2884876 RepID=UPI001D0A651F|nr:6-hydroxymethylpterin diphosphokinase MptE-like protein [Haladaptatus salinisoli]
MNFDDWEPAYAAILEDFGFSRAGDERARDALAALAVPFDRARFDDFAGRTIAVAGAGPSLDDEVDRAREADFVLAASTAADALLDAGVAVDCMVTDLDKNPETARELTERGVPVAAHAHGDNVPAIREHVPTFDAEHVLATTQAEPRGPVRNFGGFTDGDRAAFLADHFGAGRLVFLGWDFDDPAVGAAKRKKLDWAERLLRWLELRRDERFSALDGRRDGIDTSALPS